MNMTEMLVAEINQTIIRYIESGNGTIKELAGMIGVDPTTFSRKMRGKSRWSLCEGFKVLEIIDLEVLNGFSTSMEKRP